eukprot:20538-Heterococcus_DN1.PRE.2
MLTWIHTLDASYYLLLITISANYYYVGLSSGVDSLAAALSKLLLDRAVTAGSGIAFRAFRLGCLALFFPTPQKNFLAFKYVLEVSELNSSVFYACTTTILTAQLCFILIVVCCAHRCSAMQSSHNHLAVRSNILQQCCMPSRQYLTLVSESAALIGKDEHFKPFYVLGRIIHIERAATTLCSVGTVQGASCMHAYDAILVLTTGRDNCLTHKGECHSYIFPTTAAAAAAATAAANTLTSFRRGAIYPSRNNQLYINTLGLYTTTTTIKWASFAAAASSECSHAYKACTYCCSSSSGSSSSSSSIGERGLQEASMYISVSFYLSMKASTSDCACRVLIMQLPSHCMPWLAQNSQLCNCTRLSTANNNTQNIKHCTISICTRPNYALHAPTA